MHSDSRAEAKALSFKFGDDYAELNRWMGVAKQRGMTWVDSLAFCDTGNENPLTGFSSFIL